MVKEKKQRLPDGLAAKAMLTNWADRIDRLNEEIKALNSDKAEIFKEVAAEGFDKKLFQAAIKRRAKHSEDPNKAQEGESLGELYFEAIRPTPPQETSIAPLKTPANGIVEASTRARAGCDSALTRIA